MTQKPQTKQPRKRNREKADGDISRAWVWTEFKGVLPQTEAEKRHFEQLTLPYSSDNNAPSKSVQESEIRKNNSVINNNIKALKSKKIKQQHSLSKDNAKVAAFSISAAILILIGIYILTSSQQLFNVRTSTDVVSLPSPPTSTVLPPRNEQYANNPAIIANQSSSPKAINNAQSDEPKAVIQEEKKSDAGLNSLQAENNNIEHNTLPIKQPLNSETTRNTTPSSNKSEGNNSKYAPDDATAQVEQNSLSGKPEISDIKLKSEGLSQASDKLTESLGNPLDLTSQQGSLMNEQTSLMLLILIPILGLIISIGAHFLKRKSASTKEIHARDLIDVAAMNSIVKALNNKDISQEEIIGLFQSLHNMINLSDEEAGDRASLLQDKRQIAPGSIEHARFNMKVKKIVVLLGALISGLFFPKIAFCMIALVLILAYRNIRPEWYDRLFAGTAFSKYSKNTLASVEKFLFD